MIVFAGNAITTGNTGFVPNAAILRVVGAVVYTPANAPPYAV